MRLALFCSAAIFAACSGGGGSPGSGGGGGGGGGGATPTPTPAGGASAKPTATPTPKPTPLPTYVLPSASPAALSQYTINSAPTGLSVSIDGTPVGLTPSSASPNYSTTVHTITIVPSARPTSSPYVVTFVQTANGPHTVFYNEAIDTTGKIASFSASPFPTATPAPALRRAMQPRPISLRRKATTFAHRPLYDSSRIVVHFNPARFTSDRTIATVERGNGASAAVTFSQSSNDVTRIVTLQPGVSTATAMHAFASDPTVASVDHVRLRYPLGNTSSGPVYVNDPFLTNQWYLSVIDTADAWGYGLGKASVPIAIIDTGYDPLQTEVAPGVTFSERIVGGTISSAAGEATDTDGHGTLVSGVADAQTNNGAGIAGVAYGASLQEYKVYSDSTTPTADSADVAEAIREAVAHGAKVILAATGGEASAGPDPLERDAVAYALQNGVTVVAGSGDEGDSTLDYPAGYDGVISVGASAVNDSTNPGGVAGNAEYVPTYSNGPGVAGLVAPGGDPTSGSDTDFIHYIASSYTTQPLAGSATVCPAGTAPASCVVEFSGTSPAAAEVAGTAALLLSDNSSLTPPQIAQILYESADSITDPGQGHGRLNVYKAVVAAVGGASPSPPIAVPSYSQFVAFAYNNSGAAMPTILDVSYPKGVPLNATTGTFRIADVQFGMTPAPYKIAVWADVNGDGIIDAGDYFGVSSTTQNCPTTSACTAANNIVVHPVTTGFLLP
jgi:subtilisin family serine protease